MSLKHIFGLDHVLVAVRNLETAAAGWRQLGFTVSPYGAHSAHLGSANHTIVFEDDYIELLGILTETEHLRSTIDFLKSREGVARVAFTTDNAVGGAAELRERGITPIDPISFSRPVDLPDGGRTEARFTVFRWPLKEKPGGVQIFACQHFTRDAVWIPALQGHANGASGIVRLEYLVGDPKAAAAHMARLIDESPTETADGYVVKSGGKRAAFLFYDDAAFARRYPEAARAGAAPEGVVAVVLATRDVAKAKVVAGALAHGDGAIVPAKLANGIVLGFVPRAGA
jgi:hypothetical protein